VPSFDPNCLLLVAITDNLRDGPAGLVLRARAAERGGATMVHLRLRDESPRTLLAVARGLVAALRVPVLVHDRADVALAAHAAGVHLAVRELPPAALRRVVPPGFVIGVSVAKEEDVSRATGADYVGIGPVFGAAVGDRSTLGIEGFTRLAARAALPAIAIGGISSGSASGVTAAGANGVAVLSGIFAAPDPEGASRAIRAAIGR
jgi:thiamine-phosphate pyrophosphorylase